MKTPVMNTISIIATMTALCACSPSSSDHKDSSTVSPVVAKVQTQTSPLIGTFVGQSASCDGGSVATKEDKSTKQTMLTFNADGTYKSETQTPDPKTGSSLESSGTYSISGDSLILTQLSQTDGKANSPGEVSVASYKLEGNDLSLDLGTPEDGTCPANQALIAKYKLQVPTVVAQQKPEKRPLTDPE